jgi:hypothetical protein
MACDWGVFCGQPLCPWLMKYFNMATKGFRPILTVAMLLAFRAASPVNAQDVARN